jgi:predicted nucleic acid-binding protein
LIVYLDTSAAMKLLVAEAESDALTTYLVGLAPGDHLVASWLLHTELHCASGRHPQLLPRESVETVLESVSLVDLTRGDLLTAGALPGGLRSHDALHLATALRLGAEELLTYDHDLQAAARAAGLRLRHPR